LRGPFDWLKSLRLRTKKLLRVTKRLLRVKSQVATVSGIVKLK
jgi:hypothetical protein